ncbi:MAG: signal peptidase I [Candidatus Omnitrophota bacterium]|nr:signal peptidase I [Candidatus Omnitrophota bacterium]MBU3930360.1 signal peptidase I [bacterium]MBU4122762.1 signal peptidase I [bacterium]
MIKRLIFIVALGLGGAYLFRMYIGGFVKVASGSMEPTLELYDIEWASALHYALNPVERGDIIVFRSPVDSQKGLIKRVIAVGGDAIEIRDKKIYLNWKELGAEPYAVYKRENEILKGDNIPEITVPEGHVFVMGDNRDWSGDSRDWKDESGNPVYFVPVENIMGRINKDAE